MNYKYSLYALILCAMPIQLYADEELAGSWYDENGGMYIAKNNSERIAWFGQGIHNGKFFQHKASGEIKKGFIMAIIQELGGSEYYPSETKITGTISGDGNSIDWRGAKYFNKWTRTAPPKIKKIVKDLRDKDESNEDTNDNQDENDPWNPDKPELVDNLNDGNNDPWSPDKPELNWDEVIEGSEDEVTGGNDNDNVDRSNVDWDEIIDGSDGDIAENNPLSDPEPWNNPRVQELMDYWLNNARPPSSVKLGGRYNEYGQYVDFRGYTGSRPPDRATQMGRYRYLWEMAEQLPSINLGTLMQFLRHKLYGEAIPPYIPRSDGDNISDDTSNNQPKILAGEWSGIDTYKGNGVYAGKGVDFQVEVACKIIKGKHGETIISDLDIRQSFIRYGKANLIDITTSMSNISITIKQSNITFKGEFRDKGTGLLTLTPVSENKLKFHHKQTGPGGRLRFEYELILSKNGGGQNTQTILKGSDRFQQGSTSGTTTVEINVKNGTFKGTVSLRGKNDLYESDTIEGTFSGSADYGKLNGTAHINRKDKKNNMSFTVDVRGELRNGAVSFEYRVQSGSKTEAKRWVKWRDVKVEKQ